MFLLSRVVVHIYIDHKWFPKALISFQALCDFTAVSLSITTYIPLFLNNRKGKKP